MRAQPEIGKQDVSGDLGGALWVRGVEVPHRGLFRDAEQAHQAKWVGGFRGLVEDAVLPQSVEHHAFR
ncbi:hypothetical protein [Actinoplanes aureus]|uniref:Uncharacterized protein n=1 Tax=Actinoplanes aureus TaxID=2792083 RepID=A0A931CP19_9ACTN|nr:hypothetical protein [Actinoplanes aureus]MBG0568435.1 hypothetical protein [Actinoplanes aureus]